LPDEFGAARAVAPHDGPDEPGIGARNRETTALDSGIGDDERIGPMLASHVRKWIVKAAEPEEAAQRARAREKREQAQWINAPAEWLREMTAVHDWEIAHHEERARAYRRRGAIGAQGYLLDSPDERLDAQDQREHGDLIGMARRTGRLRQTQDSRAESSA
jgi:hypothetical protein